MDNSKTLDELEGSVWSEPAFTSSVVIRWHALRRKPLKELSVEDLRLLAGQQIGLDYIVPLARNVLEENPLARGDYYRGDLLMSVLTVEHRFWERRPDLRRRFDDVLSEVDALIATFDGSIRPEIDRYRKRLVVAD